MPVASCKVHSRPLVGCKSGLARACSSTWATVSCWLEHANCKAVVPPISRSMPACFSSSSSRIPKRPSSAEIMSAVIAPVVATPPPPKKKKKNLVSTLHPTTGRQLHNPHEWHHNPTARYASDSVFVGSKTALTLALDDAEGFHHQLQLQRPVENKPSIRRSNRTLSGNG